MKHLKKIFEMNELDENELAPFFREFAAEGWDIDYIGDAEVYTNTDDLNLDSTVLISNDEYPADESDVSQYSWVYEGYSMVLLLPDNGMLDPFFIKGSIKIKPNIDIREYCKTENLDYFASSKEQLELLDEFIGREIEEVEQIVKEMKEVQEHTRKALKFFENLKAKLEKTFWVLRFDDPDPMSHHFPFCLVPKFELPKKLK